MSGTRVRVVTETRNALIGRWRTPSDDEQSRNYKFLSYLSLYFLKNCFFLSFLFKSTKIHTTQAIYNNI